MDIIKLQYPVDFEGGKLSEISIRRSKVGDINRATKSSAGNIGMVIELTAILSGLPVSIIEEIDSSDYKKITDIVGGFLD